jgi:hypothetical protein
LRSVSWFKERERMAYIKILGCQMMPHFIKVYLKVYPFRV